MTITTSSIPDARSRAVPFFCTLLVVAAAVPVARGQSGEPAVFVSNNGNLEGSVSSFTIDADGTLGFVAKLVTGTRENLQQPCPGCNAYEISLAPGGRYLATSHASSEATTQQLTIYEVASDATLTVLGAYSVPSSPLDVQWITDGLLAVTRSDFGGLNEARIHSFDPAGPSLGFVDSVSTGGFTTHLALHPTLPVLYAQNSGSPYSIQAYLVAPDGTLSLLDTELTGSTFPLELALTSDGAQLYAAGGISNGGNKVIGFRVLGDGSLAALLGSPFVSPGASPSNVYPSGEDTFLVVGHGTDATARTFAIDTFGALAPTGFLFDVGLQGTFGDVRTSGTLVFITDNSTAIDGLMGIYAFTLAGNGALVANGPIVCTTGIGPRSIAVWAPTAAPCPGDFEPDGGDGEVSTPDLLALLAAWGPCGSPCPPDLDGDGVVGTPDLLALLATWGPCA